MIFKKTRKIFLSPCPIKIANEPHYLDGKQMFPSSKAQNPVLIHVKIFSLLKVDCNENGGGGEGGREDGEC